MKNLSLSIASIIIIELSLQFIAIFYEDELHSYPKSQGAQKSDVIKVLCVGESTTAWGAASSYPSQLQKLLNLRIPNLKIKVINAGETSVDTGKILKNMPQLLKQFHPDYVISMIGINDFQYLNQSSNNPLLSKLMLFKILHYAYINYLRKPKPLESRPIDKERISPPPINIELFQQANSHLEDNRIEKAEKLFTQYIQSNPNSKAAYLIGRIFFFSHFSNHINSIDLAVKYFRLSLNSSPQHLGSTEMLGVALNFAQKKTQAKVFLQKAVDHGSNNMNVYGYLADIYRKDKQFKLAETTLNKALKKVKYNQHKLWARFIYLYAQMKDSKKLHDSIQAAQKAYPDNMLFKEMEKRSKDPSQISKRKIIKSSVFYWKNSETIKNYRKIIELVQKSKAKIIVMQYPLLPIKPLQKRFQDMEGLSFIGNNKKFRSALKQHKYSELFIDKFAGRFGHFSQLGASLVAESAYKALQRELARSKKSGSVDSRESD